MRVLLINQVFHPDPQATSQYLSRVAEVLVRQRHQVTVLTGGRDYNDPTKTYPAHETWQGVEIIRLAGSGLGHATKLRRIADYLGFLIEATFRALLLPRFDVVMTLTTPPLVSVLGGFLAYGWRCRFVYWVMDLNPDEAIAVGWLRPGGMAARLLEVFSRWSLRRADDVIVLDRYMRNRIAAKGIPAEKIIIQPPWMQEAVHDDPAGRETFRREHRLEDAFLVMYAGNHSPCHPLATLFAAAVRLKDHAKIRFCFVGGGTEWAILRERAHGENLGNVTFLGYRPQAELAGLLSAADLQVVVMGDPFVGIIHPCKIYNIISARRPFIYIGPAQSHVTDLIQETDLQSQSASFRHGEVAALVEKLLQRADQNERPGWPDSLDLQKWGEAAALEKMTSVLLRPGR